METKQTFIGHAIPLEGGRQVLLVKHTSDAEGSDLYAVFRRPAVSGDLEGVCAAARGYIENGTFNTVIRMSPEAGSALWQLLAQVVK